MLKKAVIFQKIYQSHDEGKRLPIPTIGNSCRETGQKAVAFVCRCVERQHTWELNGKLQVGCKHSFCSVNLIGLIYQLRRSNLHTVLMCLASR